MGIIKVNCEHAKHISGFYNEINLAYGAIIPKLKKKRQIHCQSKKCHPSKRTAAKSLLQKGLH